MNKSIKTKQTYLIIIICLFIITLTLTITSFYEKQNIINTPVMKIGEENVNQLEYNYYRATIINNFYNTYKSYIPTIGLDTSTDLYKQECYFDGYDSWGDFFDKTTETTIQQKHALYNEAKKNNFIYDYSDLYKSFKEEISSQSSKQKISVSSMYKKLYGKYSNTNEIKKYFIEFATATAYGDNIKNNIIIDEKDVESYYNENKNNYDKVDYREFVITADISNEMTDDEKAEKLKEAKNKASAFYNKVFDEESFKSLCLEYSYDNDKNNYSKKDASLHKGESYSDISSVLSDWLFACTKEKQTACIEDTENNCYRIIYFIKRYRDESNTVNIRHILISPKVSDAANFMPTEKDYLNCSEEIKKIEKEWIEKGKTEDVFSELAKNYSNDTASASNGGLISNVSVNELEDSINTWIFENNRKNGDTEIVRSSYGYHLLFWVNKSDPNWKIEIKNILKEKKSEDKLSILLKEYPITNISN